LRFRQRRRGSFASFVLAVNQNQLETEQTNQNAGFHDCFKMEETAPKLKLKMSEPHPLASVLYRKFT